MINNSMKRCKTSLVSTERQIRTTYSDKALHTHFDAGGGKKGLTIISVGKETEKLEPSYTTDGNVKWYSHFGKVC